MAGITGENLKVLMEAKRLAQIAKAPIVTKKDVTKQELDKRVGALNRIHLIKAGLIKESK